jgi:hypothetical protein
VGGFAGSAGLLGAALAAGVIALGSPAVADDSVTVHGTAFPSPSTAQLSMVGCADLYQRSAEQLRPFISLGNSPAGQRSLGYDLAGGNAVGSLHLVSSMASTTVASLDVKAPDGSTGVAYAGYQEPAEVGSDLVWFGRADLVAPAGGWATYDASQLAYTWTKYDMSTQQTVPDSGLAGGVTMTVGEFMATRGGDGPGLYTVGFGCDGGSFTMDKMRIGSPGAVTTVDLEGLTTATSMSGSRAEITAGQRVTLTGELRTGTGTHVSRATVVLEQRTGDSSPWRRVDVVSADPHDPSVVVEPTRHTTYRWRFVDRPVAEGSVSASYDVSVAPVVEAAPHGDPTGLVVGRTFPAKPGVVATLWQLDESDMHRVGQAVVADDGTFSIDAPPGTQGRFIVTTPSDRENLTGTSAPFSIEGPEPVTEPSPSDPPSDPPSSDPKPSEAPSSNAPSPASDASDAESATASSAPTEAAEEPTALETAASSLTP